MNESIKKHTVKLGIKLKDILVKLGNLSEDAILFVIDENNKLIGSLTDGDIRRGLIKGLKLKTVVEDFVQSDPKFIIKGKNDLQAIVKFRKEGLKIIPIVNQNHQVVDILNFRLTRSYIPADVVIMAGGKGTRLIPLTSNTPKPLLKINGKSIIDHNIDRLIFYGLKEFWISINYLADKVKKHLGNGAKRNININYITENKPLGTIGAIKSLNTVNEYVLITNSDILTKLNYEEFFLNFVDNNADMSVVTIPYRVSIPYGVLETNNNHILSLKEKPKYTYYSNAGIYLVKKEILDLIPENQFFNATDLIEKLISISKKVISYPISCYWLDIGKHEDFKKAQKDILNL